MRSTALLVMDVQQGMVDRFAGDDGYLSQLAAAAEAARSAGIWVIYVTVGVQAPVGQDGEPVIHEQRGGCHAGPLLYAPAVTVSVWRL